MNDRHVLSFREGVSDGVPIFIGYFPTAIAFGLVCRNAGIRLWEAVLSSLAIYGGSSQFLGVSLLVSGSAVAEFAISVALVNLRYGFEGAAVARKLSPAVTGWRRLMVGYLTTDEVFSVSVLKEGALSWPYMAGLELTAYAGWVSGTAVGVLVGSLLSPELQIAAGVTLYGMFSALWAQETRKEGWFVIFVGLLAAAANSFLILVVHLGAGWSFVTAMLGATVVGALLSGKEEGR